MPGFLGFTELCVIFLLVLFLFGPEELPRLARALARMIYEMKNIFKKLEKEWKWEPEKKEKPSDTPLKKDS